MSASSEARPNEDKNVATNFTTNNRSVNTISFKLIVFGK